VVRKAADKKAKDDARKGIVEPEGPTLEPASETGAADVHHDDAHDDDHDDAAEAHYEDEDGDED